jgi:tetratricopeptide (TPR) repeat protein
MFKPVFERSNSLAAVVIIWACSQIACGSSPKSYVEKGNALFNAGNYAEASLNYRKALQKDYKFAEAYHKLGMAEFAQGRTDQAVDSLKQARFFDSETKIILEDLADVAFNRYLISGRTAAAYEAVTKLISELTSKYPSSAVALRLQGSLLYGNGKVREAIAQFEKSDQESPLDPAILLPLADALKLDNRPDEGEAVAMRLVKNKPGFAPGYDWLAQAYLSSGRMDDAENILKTRIQNNPRDSSAILTLGRFYRAHKRNPEADNLMSALLGRSKDFPDRYTLVGDFYASGHDWAQAERSFQAGIAAEPSGKSVYLTRLASVYLLQKRIADALRTLDDAIKVRPDNWDAQGLRISVLVASGEPAQIDQAIATSKDVIKKRTHDPRFPYLLANAYRAKGDENAAVAAYQEAARIGSQVLAPRLALAQISKEKRDAAGMLRYSGAVLAINPREPRARLIHADGLMAEGSFAEAEAEMRSLLADMPTWSEAQLDAALLLLAEKRTKPAIQAFKLLLAAAPDDQRLLAGLATAYMQDGSSDTALQLVNEQLRRDPSSTSSRSLLAAVALKSGKTDLALQQYAALAQAHPEIPDYRFQTGQIYEYMGDKKKALASYEAAAAIGQPNAIVLDRLANAYYAAGLIDQADSAYSRAVALKPSEPTLINDRAYFLAETGRNPDEAVRLAQKAVQLMPNNAALLDTLALAYIAKGTMPAAADILTVLVRSFPDVPMFRFHLAMVLLRNGGRDAAKKQLETSLTKHPGRDDEIKIRQLLATMT